MSNVFTAMIVQLGRRGCVSSARATSQASSSSFFSASLPLSPIQRTPQLSSVYASPFSSSLRPLRNFVNNRRRLGATARPFSCPYSTITPAELASAKAPASPASPPPRRKRIRERKAVIQVTEGAAKRIKHLLSKQE